MTLDRDDTIVAVATPPGRGGIGIVRLSGLQAKAIAARLLPGGMNLKPRHAHFSPFTDPAGQMIDEGLVLWFPAPHSFTGEDVRDRSGRLLLGRGSAVEDKHIRLFRAWGVSQVVIHSQEAAAEPVATATPAPDSELWQRAEAMVQDRFRFSNPDSPAVRELMRLAILRQRKRFNGEG